MKESWNPVRGGTTMTDTNHESQLSEEAEATIGQVHAALIGRTIVEVHERYGSPSIVLDNGQAFDVEPSVSCGGYCHGGTANIDYALRKAFDDEVPNA